MSQQNPIPRTTRGPVTLIAAEGQTLFSFPFWLGAAEDVEVLRALPGLTTFAPLVLGVDYVVANVGVTDGATIATSSGQAATTKIRLRGKRLAERTTSVVQGGSVRSGPLERELDLITVTLQELRRDVEVANVPADALVAAVAAAQDAAASAVPAADRAEEAAEDAADWAAVARNNFVVRTFAGDGATVAFDLGIDPGSANNCFVTVDGAPQRLAAYSVNGTVLTVTEAPAGDGVAENVEVRFGSRFAVGTPADGSVNKNKLGASSVDETKIDPAAAAAIRAVLGIKPSAYVSAHKNGTDQAGITSPTKITFGTEARDTAGWWDTTNSRLQPNVACTMQVVVALYYANTNMADSNECGVAARLNGSGTNYRGGWVRASGANGLQAVFVCDIQFNGTTDYAEFFAQFQGGNKTLLGDQILTYLQAKVV